jgi:hypothetical protein
MKLKSGEKIDKYALVGNHIVKVGEVTVKFAEFDFKNIEHKNGIHKIYFTECQ